MKNIIQKEEKEFLDIWTIIKKRNFKGYRGLAVKNSIYHFSTTFIGKIGALFFTIIIARLLLPELFGLYSLALSTIVLFASFVDLGLGSTLIKFVSSALAKRDKKKAKIYLDYLFRIKFILIFIVMVALLASAKFISQTYYQKPIFLALLAGSLYILVVGLISFIESLFRAVNKFKYPLIKQVFFQVLRLIIIPIVILLSLKYMVSKEMLFFLIISTLAFLYFLALILLIFFMKKKIPFLKIPSKNISKKDKKEINKFLLPISVTILSGAFFGYIDMVMLGRFVFAEFLGYYQAAFSLIGAAAPFITFSAVLFPIFSRLKGKRLEQGFRKSFRITLIISAFFLLLTFLLAPLAINIIFGSEYQNAIPLLRIFSILLINLSITPLYSSYLISQGRPNIVAKYLIISTLLNIVLNYLFITWFLTYSQGMAIIGAAIATITSRYVYLFALMIYRRKHWKDF